ncbi:alpha/beta fold hydrolase [Nakamurella deserti]|uniref:alpha/beta fold hydrolase n=1 Tax=Nakamurella deserti TaxID=2164074 RepID=UPI000DBE5A28|nr:alpha/beta fold hydrolase [Nakamurella deserti]
MTGRPFRPRSRTAPATLPPAGLPGLDPSWSRLVDVVDADGITRTFHVLDAGDPDAPAGTLLCVHGNPTWSYLWRRLVADPPPGWRVVAMDHLGMGWSERLPHARTLAQRVDDLGRLTDALGVTGPVVTVAHDWGGILSLGWAERHRDQLRGVVLTNTAVHQPTSSKGPILIRLAHRRLLNELTVHRTPLFVRTTTALSRPKLPADVRDAFSRPYPDTASRAAVSEFVADIPFAAGHPSRPGLDRIADAVPTLDVPALLLWGPKDPVFLEEHLRDLRRRLPQADVHRYERAGHLLPEDAPGYPAVVHDWLSQLGSAPPARRPDPALPPTLTQLHLRRDDTTPAVVGTAGAAISWADLHRRVEAIAAGLAAAGVRPGHRVALLVPPSIDLTVALYAVWRAGAVIVVADKGLGLRGMGRALRSAQLDHVVADTAGLLAAGPMRLPGSRIAVRPPSPVVARLSGARTSLAELERRGAGLPAPAEPGPEAEAAVLFTSGATGPAKGVRYRDGQVRAQLALIRSTYQLTPDDRIVAAFAPFALYGPALGIPSAVPDTDVTQPGTLTAAALADAAARIAGTVVFASPAALRNVLATAGDLTDAQRTVLSRVRLLMSAGAPVPAALLQSLQKVLPRADMHTPYGMTEALPLTDVSLPEILEAGDGDGVCVGRPLAGVELAVVPPDRAGHADGELTDAVGATGEIWARAPHLRDSYDALWVTDRAAAAHPGWHRTGDVGHRDAAGRWWIEGRTAHLVLTDRGPVTPVGVEQRVQRALGDDTTAAVVGVGPAGVQQVVVVLTGTGPVLPDLGLADAVRAAAAPVPVAAVLVREALPVDIRHNSKIDRTALAAWATDTLAGR